MRGIGKGNVNLNKVPVPRVGGRRRIGKHLRAHSAHRRAAGLECAQFIRTGGDLRQSQVAKDCLHQTHLARLRQELLCNVSHGLVTLG